jgi:hypothetical protein
VHHRLRRLAGIAILVPLLGAIPTARASASTSMSWKGHRWNITTGAMAGVAPGRTNNVFVDSHGYLHLRLVRRGRTVTAAQLFSHDRMGFGTYQWQIHGAIGHMDPSAVLGLFPYGPQDRIGVDGENELDIEFSRWNATLCGGRCNGDFTFWPSTHHRSLGPAEHDFTIGTETVITARLIWTSRRVTGVVMRGLQPIGKTAAVLNRWTFAPRDSTARIPQQPVPVGMNLWAYQKAPARSQEVVLRAFQFVASK